MACIDQLFDPAKVGRDTILEANPAVHPRLFALGDYHIRTPHVDINRLFNEDVKTTTCGRDALFRVQARGTSDSNQTHRAVPQERLEVCVNGPALALAQLLRFFLFESVD